MLPVLLRVGDFPVQTYGAMIALGFLMALGCSVYLGKKESMPIDFILDFGFWVFIVGLIGARIVFVLTQLNFFSMHPDSIFRIWEGGLVFYGGPLLAAPFGVWYVRKKGYSAWKMFDVAMPSVVIAHMFGRLGCLGAGCCHGLPTQSIFGVIFDTPMVDARYRGMALHPTQAYEAFGLLVIFVTMLKVYPKKAFDGQIGILYLLTYPLLRFGVELFRGDDIRGFLGLLSTSQWISIFLWIVGVFLMVIRLKVLKVRHAK